MNNNTSDDNTCDDMNIKNFTRACSIVKRGIEVLRDPHFNKGRCFSLKERQFLGIHGLLPPKIATPEDQLQNVLDNFNHWENDLDKYIYLMALQDRNEKLFYSFLCTYTELAMPIVYTPTVGLACQEYGMVFRRPRGLYITIKDIGHVKSILKNWPEQDIRVIVMTDGERILGLGDLGACGMGIPVGKLSLYTAIGGVSPRYCLPITLDVGCNNDDLVSQHTYIGLSERRTIGAAYDSLVDECMHSITEVYGRNTLIQFEDFANFNAFRFLQKYRNTFCTFNDDIQGTASVVVAGLLAAVRITQIPFIENTFLFLGAGEASLGIAELLVLALVSSGLSIEKARERIFLFDSCGLVVRNRKRGSNAGHKIIFAKNLAETKDFLSAVNLIQPSVLIGAAAVPQAFTEEILSQMAAFNKRPIIFALSNPTKKAECTAQQAYTHTNGQCIFASGSPFPPVTYDGKTFYTGQGNNAYIFPGVGLGVIAAGIKTISEEYFFIAAKALAEKVTDSMLAEGRVYPPLSDIRETSNYISEKIMEHAYKKNQASLFPKPSNILQYIQKICYNCTYETFLPDIYEWK